MARHRVYRYRLEAMEFWVEPELEAFKRWLKHFVGTYDARNFARLEEGKNPVRTVLDAKPWMDGDRLMGFEIKGEAFLWNQVRRVANALFRLSVGELEEHQVVSAIQEPMTSVEFGVAPPEWLVLWGVPWDDAPSEESHATVFTPPTGRTAERTRKGRWRKRHSTNSRPCCSTSGPKSARCPWCTTDHSEMVMRSPSLSSNRSRRNAVEITSTTSTWRSGRE